MPIALLRRASGRRATEAIQPPKIVAMQGSPTDILQVTLFSLLFTEPDVLQCQKDRFRLPDDLTYLNLAYMAPLADTVESAGIAGVQRRRDPTSLGVSAMFDEVDDLKEGIARILGISDASRMAVVPSVSYGLACAAGNLDDVPGTDVVVCGAQFPSNYYAWKRYCERSGGRLRVVPPPPPAEGRGHSWNQQILAAIDADTAVVALPNIHWSDGTVFDLESIREATLAVDAALVIDATQSAGARPMDFGALRADAVVCASYKSLLGPYGMGFAYFSERFDDGVPLEETWSGRERSDDFANLVDYQDAYRPHAARYDVGERCNFITMPMAAAAFALIDEWQPQRIEEYCRQLTRSAIDRLRGAGYWVEDEELRAAHLFGVLPPKHVVPEAAHQHLTDHGISVSRRGAFLRISPHVYNRPEDLDRLADALVGLA